MKTPLADSRRRAQVLRDQAEHKRSLAAGVLGYGWLDSDTRQERHDNYLAEADKLDAQAVNLTRDCAGERRQ